jgi:hypothetical protein
MNNSEPGQIMVNNSFLKTYAVKDIGGCFYHVVAIKNVKLLHFMESSRTKPILIENSEKTLLETENLNFRLDFVTGLKRKLDDMEFTLAKRFKRE